jgi:putative phage-type endonuclease
MKVVDLKQRTPEWHAWRNAGVTASEAAVLLGSPYKTPWRLWGEKRGLILPEDLSGNPHVQRGIREEPKARRRFEERHDVMLLPLCAESSAEPILRASFDGLTDDGRPVELKAPTEDNFREAVALGGESLLYRRYYAQVQTQIFVADADQGMLSLHHGEEVLDVPVPRDDHCIEQIVERAREFWECIRTGKEPPLDPDRDLYVPSGPDQETWLRLAAEYRQLDDKLGAYVAEAKAIEKKLAGLEGAFLAQMGEFSLAESSGVRISRFLQQGAIDYKAALKALSPDLPDSELEVYRRKPAERVRITVRQEDGDRTEVPFEPDVLKQVAGSDFWF